jgi:hypothetical protein
LGEGGIPGRLFWENQHWHSFAQPNNASVGSQIQEEWNIDEGRQSKSIARRVESSDGLRPESQ